MRCRPEYGLAPEVFPARQIDVSTSWRTPPDLARSADAPAGTARAVRNLLNSEFVSGRLSMSDSAAAVITVSDISNPTCSTLEARSTRSDDSGSSMNRAIGSALHRVGSACRNRFGGPLRGRCKRSHEQLALDLLDRFAPGFPGPPRGWRRTQPVSCPGRREGRVLELNSRISRGCSPAAPSSSHSNGASARHGRLYGNPAQKSRWIPTRFVPGGLRQY